LFEEAGPKHAKALRRIGLLLEDQKDNVSAAFHLRQAADLGDVKASYKLYTLLFKNRTLPLSDSAFYYLYYAARAGHAKACAKIGFCYLYDPQTLPGGMTIAQDKVIGARWYEESAKGNYPRAFYRLGLIYLHGWANYPKSPLKALEFFRRAEQAGDKLVLLEMAKIYNVGLAGSLEADSKQAFEYYKKAADHQYCEAWYQLGKRHMEGIGTVKNTEQALVCWEKAATLGCKDSKASLVSYHIAAAAKYRA
jgi:TPR repeat protein